MTMKEYSAEEAKKLKGKSDLERLDKMTEDELEEAATSDPDSAWPTDDELKEFKRPSEEFRKRFKTNEQNNG